MPKPRKNSILRLHLFEKLDKMQTCKVGIIEGMAGSGKTTLLSSYFHSQQKPVQWLSIHEECNFREVFWAYMKELFMKEQIFQHDIVVSADIADNIRSLLNNLKAEEYFLVLDNIHLLTDTDTLSSLSYFLEQMDEHMHVILCGRSMPDIYLGKLMMEGQLFRIQSRDLLFQVTEELQFLKTTLELNYSEDVMITMCEKAGGWVGGLQLMVIAQSGKSEKHLQLMEASDPYVESYITKEIFEHLHQQQQYFLTAISILHSFDIPFLEMYLPQLRAKDMLAAIWKQHFIVSILDDVAGVYCLHDILKEYLQHQFTALSMDAQYQLREKAAQICKRYGNHQECIYHYVMNKDYTHAMKVICETPQNQKVLHYLKQIPIDIICENPDFAYQYFFYYYANFEEEACNRIYRMIYERFREDPTFAAFRWSSVFLSGEDYMKQPIVVLPYDEIIRLPLKKETISFLLIKDAFLLAIQHRSKESLLYLDKVMILYEETKNMFIGSMLFLVQTQIYEFLGEFHLAMQAYQYICSIVDTLTFQKSTYYVGIAGLYMKRFKIEEAMKALELCDIYNTKQIYGIYRAWMYTKAQVYCVLQDVRAIPMIETLLTDATYKNLCIISTLLRLLYLWKPKHTCFQVFMKQHDDKPYEDYDSMLLYAQLMEAQGNIKTAVEIVHTVLIQARKSENRYSLIEAALFNLHLQLQTSYSLASLENIFLEAITYASENDIVLPFLFIKDDWAVIMNIMHACIAYRLTTKQRAFVLHLPIVQKATLLTQREWEVLKALATGKSNKEIAISLCISLATVKTHVLNIYGKLHVNNRIEATNYYHEHSCEI